MPAWPPASTLDSNTLGETLIDPALEAKLLKIHSAAAVGVGLPPAQRNAFVRDTPECQEREFAELLLAVAREQRLSSPRDSIHCGQLAAVAMEVRRERGRDGGEDLRALSWAEVGNGHRIFGEYRAASHSLARATDAADQLQAETLVQIWQIQAGLQRYLCDTESSFRLLAKAGAAAHRLGAQKQLAKAYLLQSTVACFAQNYELAIESLESVLGHLPIADWPELHLVAIHNLADTLIRAGDPRSGRELLLRHQEAYERSGSSRIPAQRLWALGLANCALGRSRVGEAELFAALQRYRQLQTPHEEAQVLLELALLYANQRRWRDVRRFGEMSLALARSNGHSAHSQNAEVLLRQIGHRK